MSTEFTPTIRNVKALWRWTRGTPTTTVVRIDWMTVYTQEQARRWLRSRLQERITRGAPVLAKQSDYPPRRWRRLDYDHQTSMWRDAEIARALASFPRAACQWGYRFNLPETRRRLGHLEGR